MIAGNQVCHELYRYQSP